MSLLALLSGMVYGGEVVLFLGEGRERLPQEGGGHVLGPPQGQGTWPPLVVARGTSGLEERAESFFLGPAVTTARVGGSRVHMCRQGHLQSCRAARQLLSAGLLVPLHRAEALHLARPGSAWKDQPSLECAELAGTAVGQGT